LECDKPLLLDLLGRGPGMVKRLAPTDKGPGRSNAKERSYTNRNK
jgi:hypothetical protein